MLLNSEAIEHDKDTKRPNMDRTVIPVAAELNLRANKVVLSCIHIEAKISLLIALVKRLKGSQEILLLVAKASYGILQCPYKKESTKVCFCNF